MPSARKQLQNKYMSNGSDGIEECENIVKKYGANITDKWVIEFSMQSIKKLKNSEWTEFWDAMEFLLMEWDYDSRNIDSRKTVSV